MAAFESRYLVKRDYVVERIRMNSEVEKRPRQSLGELIFSRNRFSMGTYLIDDQTDCIVYRPWEVFYRVS